jgi:TRAP-type C4-dicarboxylate transport system substrate-binding protein
MAGAMTMTNKIASLRAVLCALTVCALCVVASPAWAECSKTLKVASLAPTGSEWYKAIESTARKVKEQTGGEVCFKIYAGGVMGDEGAMVKKMRTGQLDGAVLTSVGLGGIKSDLLVLQLPLTFQSNKQLDYVREKMSGTFEGLLNGEGFSLLGWGDVGFNYLFSKEPIATPDDAKKSSVKVWVWDADPVSKEVMKVSGISATPLGVPDVLPSLQTGVVNSFLNSPYGAIALQWHTKANHITDLKLAVTIGGTVISSKSMEGLTPDQQKILRDVSAEEHRSMLAKVRSSNDAAQTSLVKKHGYKVVPVADFAAWKKVADQVKANLSGKTYTKEVLAEMERHLASAPK